MLKFEDLQDGKECIATDKAGRKYKGIFVDKYIPGGVFYCCYPMFYNGEKNELVSFEEV